MMKDEEFKSQIDEAFAQAYTGKKVSTILPAGATDSSAEVQEHCLRMLDRLLDEAKQAGNVIGIVVMVTTDLHDKSNGHDRGVASCAAGDPRVNMETLKTSLDTVINGIGECAIKAAMMDMLTDLSPRPGAAPN